jgi:predicted TPR repeat methyltransferase
VKCRGCGSLLSKTFIDLGESPIANDLRTFEQLGELEQFFPLHTRTCDSCGLVQLPEISSRETLFPKDYNYYSSYSKSWLAHSQKYAIKMKEKLGLTDEDLVVEVASNDGYLLQYFQKVGIPVLGIEPAAEVAAAAKEERNIPTLVEFFGEETANRLVEQNVRPRLMIANNVLAHVPDIHDFVAGFTRLLEDDGIITFEFPHLLNLILLNQFDTIYHEHFSYLSVTSLVPIFAKHGLRIFDVEELDTHGGSLRIFVCKTNSFWKEDSSVEDCIYAEGIHDPRSSNIASKLQISSQQVRVDLCNELERIKESGKTVAAYGAAAKGNTLLNFAGVKSGDIEYVVDRNPHKQGKYLPGSHIPVVSEDYLQKNPPDVLLILPWNLAVELSQQLEYLKKRGVKFLRAIPSLEYF